MANGEPAMERVRDYADMTPARDNTRPEPVQNTVDRSRRYVRVPALGDPAGFAAPKTLKTSGVSRSDAVDTDISIVLPVLDGGEIYGYLLRHLIDLRQRLGVEVLVIDSGSNDSTAEDSHRAGFRVHRIPPEDFGHGRTRQLGVELARGDIVCFLTQDVLPCTPDWPLRFAEALNDPRVAGVYGRQVPRDATTMEMFFVSLNYPEHRLRFDPQPGGHHPRPGRVVFSNAFSAVRRGVALDVPIPEDRNYSEDQRWAHRVLMAGYSIAYEPAAEALHAHHYSIRGLFQRTYRVGRGLRASRIASGATIRQSLRFLSNEVRYAVRQGHVHRLPHLLAYEFVRWAGFRVGRLQR